MPEFEASLLDLALRKGLVKDEDVARSRASLSRGESETVLWSQYGEVLDALLAEGLLQPEQLRTLAEELAPSGVFPTLAGLAQAPSSALRVEAASRAFPVPAWDRYEEIEYLAQGGMARVFRARDPRLKRPVAIKLLDNPNPAALKRFVQEAQAQARVGHPHVCRIYEVGEVAGHPYIAMELVDGLPIDKVRGELGLEQKVRALKDVAEAVHAAHRLGLIHRDLKPPNILMEHREEGWWPVVLDFGLAGVQESQGLTVAGTLMGTPEYMAPEQARGDTEHLDRRTDVYALGATLFSVLLGRAPFRADALHQLLTKVLNEEPPRPRSLDPNLPEDLETILLKCLEKEPHLRYDSARLLADDLQRYLDGEPLLARPAGWRNRARRVILRNRALSAVVACASAALLTLGAWAARAQWQARTQAQLAQRFGLESERMEGSFRLAQRLPRHDLRPEKAGLRAWMARLEQEMIRLGPATTGPGHFALGRACLALGESRQALAHLETAWRAGNQGPESAAALGLAHASVLEDARREAEGLAGKEAKATRLAELWALHGQPALYFLRLSGTGASRVQEGRIAFLEARYDEALALARLALAGDPWLVEAHKLVAQVELARGRVSRERGDDEAADQASGRGLAAALETEDLARSDVEAYLLEGDARTQVMDGAQRRGRPMQAEARAAHEALDRALGVDPDSAEAHVRMARLYCIRADAAMDRGLAPEPLVAEAIAHGREALRCNPVHPEAALLLARTYRFQADRQASLGQDPLPALEQALAIGQRAIALRPRDAISLNNQGNALLSKAEVIQDGGRDATGALEEALAAFLASSRLNPSFSAARINQGICYRRLATQKALAGEDPLPLMAKGQEAYREALALNPRHVTSLNNLGTLCRFKAEMELRAGLDPARSLQEAEDAFRRALAVNPAFARSHAGLGDVATVRGLWDRGRGADPMPAFREALAHHRRAFAFNPSDPDQFQKCGETWFEVAAYGAARGHADGDALTQAARAADQALRINGRRKDSLLLKARVALLQPGAPGALAEAARVVAMARIIGPQSAEPRLLEAAIALARAGGLRGAKREASLKQAEDALAQVPASAQREALTGMLCLQRARGGGGAALAGQAQAHLQRACHADHLLALTYRPYLSGTAQGK